MWFWRPSYILSNEWFFLFFSELINFYYVNCTLLCLDGVCSSYETHQLDSNIWRLLVKSLPYWKYIGYRGPPLPTCGFTRIRPITREWLPEPDNIRGSYRSTKTSSRTRQRSSCAFFQDEAQSTFKGIIQRIKVSRFPRKLVFRKKIDDIDPLCHCISGIESTLVADCLNKKCIAMLYDYKWTVITTTWARHYTLKHNVSIAFTHP